MPSGSGAIRGTVSQTVTGLLVRVEAEWFALPLAAVVEVTPIAALSGRAVGTGAVVGWLDLRGEAVPVLDTSALLNVSPSQVAATDRFVVIEVNGGRAAIAVQEVSTIEDVTVEADSERDGMQAGRAGGRLVQLVDPVLLSGGRGHANG